MGRGVHPDPPARMELEDPPGRREIRDFLDDKDLKEGRDHL